MIRDAALAADYVASLASHYQDEIARPWPDVVKDVRQEVQVVIDAVFEATGTTILRTAVRAPRMNATCERLIGTLRRELLDRVLILGQAHLRAVLTEYQAHYNTGRPHQGIAQRVPRPACVTAARLDARRIRRKPILSGLINEYTQAA